MPTPEDITHQQTLLTTYRRTLAHYLQQLALQGEANAPPVVTHGINEARTNIQRIKAILRGWGVSVEDKPNDEDVQQPTNAEPAKPAAQVDRVALKKILDQYFNEEELRDLTFELNIDYESLPGQGKGGKARELIAYAERHSLYTRLVETVRRLRANIT